jgi:RNA polymerase sigma factor (sigma-70 family)
MPIEQLHGVIQQLRRAALLQDGTAPTDGQLLRDYLGRRDEAALAALVQRHGPMVWGVCRRVLGHYHDAEDAFQATFLVLVRRAASIAAPERLANWLYGVAHQTALKARATAGKRQAREKQMTDMPEPAVAAPDLWNDLQPRLDQELSRLPDIYRTVLVLCELEGKTRAETARQLGLPEGTVASRLARARAMLAKRLTDRGITVSAAALAAVLAQNVAPAGVPDSVVLGAITAASFFAAGRGAATGLVSVKVFALAEGVLKAMMIRKLKAVVAVVLALGFAVTGASALAFRTLRAGQPPAAEGPALAPAKQEQDPPQKQARADAEAKPIKIRVYIDKVHQDTSTIAASCMLIGEMDGVTKPLRFDNLRVADKAQITDRGKALKLADLKLLPRDTHYYLFLKSYEDELGFEVVGIETIRPPAADPGAPQKQGARQQAARNLSKLMDALKRYQDDPRHGRLPPAVPRRRSGADLFVFQGDTELVCEAVAGQGDALTGDRLGRVSIGGR